MVKFLIKKSFFEGWDNLIPQFLYNIGCMAIIAAFLFIDNLCEGCNLVVFFMLIAGFGLLYTVYNFGLGGVTHNWSTYQGTWGSGFFEALKGHFWHIVFFWFIALFCAANIIIVIPSYMNSQTLLGAVIAFLQIWIVLFIAIAMQYYIPLCMFLDGENPLFILKQCFVLFFDNKLFTLFVSIRTVVDFYISALSFFFIPGLGYISITHMDAVNLLHQRYRWAKEHNVPTKNVVIFDMLEEERTNLGKRTLRGMFRPWKDGR